ncbi:DUF1285 domain-containing protein [Thalassotalea sp. PLHSN55]|uniref:DUF1285 domain-containing protein n=1 Tax=Thalassotalea sp. PLHSN55 TaxID=3435888 RepID=UPI003F85F4D6
MSLEKISAQLSTYSESGEQKIPPVELWDPPYCGEIDIEIKADGSWYYNGTVFKRIALVKLLASVLKKEGDDYFLVTPVEKIKIRVEDAPFVLTQWQWHEQEPQTMVVSTHLDNQFLLNSEHPLEIAEDGSLYVTVRHNLTAKVHRNVYYQWVDLAKEQQTANGVELVFESAGLLFSLGSIA